MFVVFLRVDEALKTIKLKAVKMASAGYYDELPTSGNEGAQAFRDIEWEEKIHKICRKNTHQYHFYNNHFSFLFFIKSASA